MSNINKICKKCEIEKPRVQFMRDVFNQIKNKFIYKENIFCNSCAAQNTLYTPIKHAKLIYKADKTIGNKAHLDLIIMAQKEKTRLKVADTIKKKWDKRIKNAITDLQKHRRHLSKFSITCKRPLADAKIMETYIKLALSVLDKVAVRMKDARYIGKHGQLGDMNNTMENWSESLRAGTNVPSDEWLALVPNEDAEAIKEAYQKLVDIKGRVPKSVLVPTEMVVGSKPTQADIERMAAAAQRWAQAKARLAGVMSKRAATQRISAGRHNTIEGRWPTVSKSKTEYMEAKKAQQIKERRGKKQQEEKMAAKRLEEVWKQTMEADAGNKNTERIEEIRGWLNTLTKERTS